MVEPLCWQTTTCTHAGQAGSDGNRMPSARVKSCPSPAVIRLYFELYGITQTERDLIVHRERKRDSMESDMISCRFLWQGDHKVTYVIIE